jgi:hypothetical protein
VTVVQVIFAAGYLTLLGLFIRFVCRRLPGGRSKRDLNICRDIWPDPPSARVIEAQQRIDTAKQKKQEEQ